MTIECLVLGAGQEVGKSCVVTTIGGKKIMFDCGMHMGLVDDPYPDFSRISPTGDFTSVLSCIIITHFHLDHVGALPFFTEVCGYHGPIYMTSLKAMNTFNSKEMIFLAFLEQYPTKALAPLMLEDYRKVMVERRGEKEQFTSNDIQQCMKKVRTVDIKQVVQVDKDLQIRAYYAGHVLGAAMFYAKVGESTLVYTGDYNMTPDRHLGAAQIDRLQLDILITESTYATTIRDSKYAREREFLKVVHKCVVGGGKVLIPTFAMGRAQELCMLLDDYWERLNLKVPIYFSAGLTVQANMYYKMLIGWTSQKIKDSYVKHNPFDFKHVQPFNRSQICAPGPCVLFATPGMLTGGFSLEVFKHWAPSEKNLVTLPGYCLAGTVGHKLMSGKATKIQFDKSTEIDVRCQIHQLSFSPHTDSKGIMDLVRYLSPRHVILVHGEKPNMEKLKGKIQLELGIQCYVPANNETLLVPTTQTVKVSASKMFMRKVLSSNLHEMQCFVYNIYKGGSVDSEASQLQLSRNESLSEGILVMEKAKQAKILHEDEVVHTLNVQEHNIRLSGCFPVDMSILQSLIPQLPSGISYDKSAETVSSLNTDGWKCGSEANSYLEMCNWLYLLKLKLEELVDYVKSIRIESDEMLLGSLCIHVCQNDSCPHRNRQVSNAVEKSVFFCCTWSFCDELAHQVITAMKNQRKN